MLLNNRAISDVAEYAFLRGEKGSVLETRSFSSASFQFQQQFGRGIALTMTDAADMAKEKLLRNPQIRHRGMRPNESGDGSLSRVTLS